MRSAVILSLASTSLAAPFGERVFDAFFGHNTDVAPTESFASFPPIATGSDGVPAGTATGGLPIGTGTGLPYSTGISFPTGSGAVPNPTQAPSYYRPLSIVYDLAPTSAPAAVKERRQASIDPSAAESFTFLDPSAIPTGTDIPIPSGTGVPAFPIPSGTGVPQYPFPSGTGFPSIPFPTGTDVPAFPIPTGGFPALPTSLATLTRGPQPTPTGAPGSPSEPEVEWWQRFQEWVENVRNGNNQNDE